MKHTDVIVVGGGVIGLSIALAARERGLTVRLLEQGSLGKQASWAGAGMLPPGRWETANPGEPQLRGLSDSLWSSWSESLRDRTGIDNGFRRCGGVQVGTAEQAGEIERHIALWQAEQVPCEPLDAQSLRQIEPRLSDRFTQGYLLPSMGQVRNPRHLKALIAALTVMETALVEHQPVLEIVRDGEAITGLRTSTEVYTAREYVFASGSWTASVLEPIRPRLDVFPVRGQIALLFDRSRPLERIVEVGKRYLVPRGDGRILVGSTEELVGFDAAPTAGGISGLLQFACDVCPALEQATIERTWAGLRPGTRQPVPFIGPLEPWRNAWAATGHFRSGLQLSIGTAVLLVDLITGASPAIDPAPFQWPLEG